MKNYKLLTPGPLTTTDTVKQEMIFDHCTWDDDYKKITQKIQSELLDLAHADKEKYACVLMQGSGTFGVESVLSSVIKDSDKLLIVANGAYGKRMADIAEHNKINHIMYLEDYNKIPDSKKVAEILDENPDITHVSMVHSETTSGILNDIEAVAKVVKEKGRIFITDAMSIPPCQYGVLQWKEDGSMEYSTESVDVSVWAKRTEQENTDLLDFVGWSEHYIQKLIADQIGGVVHNVGSDVKRSMAVTYADVYIDYYAGRNIDAKGVRTSQGYTWWERNLPDSYLLKELNSMINDSDRDNNYLLLPEDTILEERYAWKKATASEASPSEAGRQ